VFSGTTCTGGQTHVLVVHTGMQTEIGRIAALSQRVRREPSPLERQVRRVAWLIAAVAIAAGLAFIPFGALVAGLSLTDAVIFAIGLLVANVPEGLLPTITLALAVGVRELARSGALVKRLSAVETLGSTSVICTDKTGTLTQNTMSAVLAWSPADGEASLEMPAATPSLRRLGAAIASSNTADLQDDAAPADPTDIALLRAAGSLGAGISLGARMAGRVATFHFDPQRRLMTTVDAPASDSGGSGVGDCRADGATSSGTLVVHTKGAPEEVLARSSSVLGADGVVVPLDDARRQNTADALAPYAASGLRVIAAGDRTLAPGGSLAPSGPAASAP
jgi:magnesium-transporting ATPase (P-type)